MIIFLYKDIDSAMKCFVVKFSYVVLTSIDNLQAKNVNGKEMNQNHDVTCASLC